MSIAIANLAHSNYLFHIFSPSTAVVILLQHEHGLIDTKMSWYYSAMWTSVCSDSGMTSCLYWFVPPGLQYRLHKVSSISSRLRACAHRSCMSCGWPVALFQLLSSVSFFSQSLILLSTLSCSCSCLKYWSHLRTAMLFMRHLFVHCVSWLQ